VGIVWPETDRRGVQLGQIIELVAMCAGQVSRKGFLERYPGKVSWAATQDRFPGEVPRNGFLERYPGKVSWRGTREWFPGEVPRKGFLERYPGNVSRKGWSRNHTARCLVGAHTIQPDV
jgi:hypothetical protein